MLSVIILSQFSSRIRGEKFDRRLSLDFCDAITGGYWPVAVTGREVIADLDGDAMAHAQE